MATSNSKQLSTLSQNDTERFRSKVDNQADGCWPWLGTRDQDGYGLFSICTYSKRAHRIAYFLATGIDPGPLNVLHICDNPICVRASPDDVGTYEVNGIPHPRCGHLWLGTNADNTADMVAKGRQSTVDTVDRQLRLERARAVRGDRNGSRTRPDRVPRGENHWASKLTNAQRLTIAQEYIPQIVSQKFLAIKYGISQTTICDIVQPDAKWRRFQK